MARGSVDKVLAQKRQQKQEEEQLQQKQKEQQGAVTLQQMLWIDSILEKQEERSLQKRRSIASKAPKSARRCIYEEKMEWGEALQCVLSQVKLSPESLAVKHKPSDLLLVLMRNKQFEDLTATYLLKAPCFDFLIGFLKQEDVEKVEMFLDESSSFYAQRDAVEAHLGPSAMCRSKGIDQVWAHLEERYLVSLALDGAHLPTEGTALTNNSVGSHILDLYPEL
ncbi:hypothetical protein AK812_SmicGene351 [Symbiodinium microadriaticum]|uniref:Uncharacterized protein n=1 Tax=Symbiodinium microadriaticum TaxID=2951 RepID=A0A1Q9F6W0_SYMMI|nr:hypothetical protein AK812_SmicGene351 [Symbiodinium microadriaticum]